MTNENDASGPPWPMNAVPWPKLGIASKAGLESVWAVGPAEGPVMHFGSAGDPRQRWKRLAKASPVPLMVHDLRWAQGNKGRALARAVRRVNAGPIGPSEHRLMVEVEAARLGIALAEHVPVVRAVDNDAQADLDAFVAQCRAADDKAAMERHPDLSLAEIRALRQPTGYEQDVEEYHDNLLIEGYDRWERKHRRSNPLPPRKLFQRNRSIVKAYKDGATLANIGMEHGISFGRVRRILDDMGVDRRPRGGYFARNNP